MEKERTQKRQAGIESEHLAEDITEEIIAKENVIIENAIHQNSTNENLAQKYITKEDLSIEDFEAEENDDTSSVKIPKNVRQIGIIDKKSRIYVEDYVVTYLKRLRREQKHPFGVAALYGKVTYVNSLKYVFVAGAAYREADDNYEDGLTEDMLLYYKECGQNYFQDYTGVGIAVIHDGNIRIPVKWHQKINLAGLVGRGEVFIDINCDEEEAEYAFVHDDGVEIKEGHYIYYDKNEAMQSFMVDWREKGQVHEPEEDRDEVVSESCRLVLDDKKESRRMSFATFCTSASSIILLAGMCIVGINMMNHGQEVSSGEVQVSTISQENALEQAAVVQVINEKSEEEQMGTSLDDFINNQAITSDTETIEENSGMEEPAYYQKENINYEDTKEDLSSTEKTDSLQDEVKAELSAGLENEALEYNNQDNGSTINQKGTETDRKTSERQAETDTVLEPDMEDGDTQETVGQAEKITEKYSDYKIKKGDTLYEICMKRYGSISKLHDICIKNDIEDQDSIYYGQIIKLPEE